MANHLVAADSRAKWNQRHQQRSMPVPACKVLQEHCDLLPASGTALDLACGLGGNAVLLAKSGLSCAALDISDIALIRLHDYAQEQKLSIHTELVNIENDNFTLAPQCYDVIVVSYFLYRPLFSALAAALKPGGLLFYQTFVNAGVKDQAGPKNKSFYLSERELLSQFQNLDIRYYCERANDDGLNASTVAELIACKPNALKSLQ